MLYQLYHSLPFLTLISSSSLYLKLQPELLLKVITLKGLWEEGGSEGIRKKLKGKAQLICNIKIDEMIGSSI